MTRKTREIRFLNETLTIDVPSRTPPYSPSHPVVQSHDTMYLMDGDVYRGSLAREIEEQSMKIDEEEEEEGRKSFSSPPFSLYPLYHRPPLPPYPRDCTNKRISRFRATRHYLGILSSGQGSFDRENRGTHRVPASTVIVVLIKSLSSPRKSTLHFEQSIRRFRSPPTDLVTFPFPLFLTRTRITNSWNEANDR